MWFSGTYATLFRLILDWIVFTKTGHCTRSHFPLGHAMETRVVDLIDRRTTAFKDEFQPPAPSEMCANSHSTAHLVTGCSCSSALCKEMNWNDKDPLHADLVHNGFPFFRRSVQRSFLQVASERTPLEQHRQRLKVVKRGPSDGTTPSSLLK